MRFGWLVALVAVPGAIAGVGMQMLLAPASPSASDEASASSPMRVQAEDPAQFHFHLRDLNPLRLIFDYEQASINAKPAPLPMNAPRWGQMMDLSKIQGQRLDLDSPQFRRAMGQSIADQFERNRERQEDLMNYARNPAGWHGAPPN